MFLKPEKVPYWEYNTKQSLYIRKCMKLHKKKFVGRLFRPAKMQDLLYRTMWSLFKNPTTKDNACGHLTSKDIFLIIDYIDQNRMLQIIVDGEMYYTHAKVLAYSNIVP